ncbi:MULTISPECIES: YiaA/YiaB family inner membrane protein [Nocardiopsis]|uniref:YiaA/YiaB family inner membrane protein n=1 Tax=Nocardiopsis lambiniae TaxID=3075539 RepID=A0ABU2MG55_9ACTN|nr:MULTISPECIES: YiaA/YiaB family inner membrane protein [unclassified Nocardiopsis]MDE3722051.1 YiaA/YiaB family inner membrane protein [Nocardiopsis sp. N85]MDT0331573.1 YiaA/YiaB family inner membrane protein [Nocardiopsis sp. DSM 44743]
MNLFAPTPRSSPQFYLQSMISFAAASLGLGVGIVFLPVDLWIRAFLGMGLLYVVTATFTLAKCVRDRQEDQAAAEAAQQYQQWNGAEQVPQQR